jgi:hypothetical protein
LRIARALDLAALGIAPGPGGLGRGLSAMGEAAIGRCGFEPEICYVEG